ncbi:shikimate dehydrogenase [Deltaproteobacteria bacterium]|nr:shikimate dehydrogenase [Deltaproteobacteria bacterium]
MFALLGHPIRHSLSPAMHNELFRRLGVDAVYVALDVRPDDAERVADSIRTLGLAGCNLTVPFKERVVPGLDALSEAAACSGAVNVVLSENGKLIGHNTDGEGYLAALREELEVEVGGRRCVVLGAGGTGRAVAAALAGAGVASVTFLNRTAARAEHAVSTLAPRFPGVRFGFAPLTAAAFGASPWDLVVNCLSGAGVPAVLGFPVDGLAPGAVWTDANYWMADPPLLSACAARGVRIQRGIGMLLHQGARSFELFTGHRVSSDTVRGVLNIGGW